MVDKRLDRRWDRAVSIRGRLLTLAVGCLTVALLPAVAVAHGGHATHSQREISLLPITVFGASLLVLGAGLFLDSRPDVAGAYATAGIAIGVGGLLAAISLFLF